MRSIAFLRCVLLVATGLSTPLAGRAQAPAPYPLGRDLTVFEAPSDAMTAPPVARVEPTGVLRLADALAASLLHNAEFATDAYELRAREAALLQARSYPNPSLAFDVQDFAGSGDFRGFDNAQTTLLIGQLIELGGKRSARIELASTSLALAGWDYEMRRIDVLVYTAAAFVDVLAAQERHRLADETLELARRLQAVAAKRLSAGIASPAEGIRADLEVDVAEVEREHSEHELATARQTLAAAWSGDEAHFDHVDGDLELLPVVPSLPELTQRLDASPSLLRWQAELAQRDALQAKARGERVPDVTLFAGPRYFSGPDDVTVVAGVSVPLPLWNRNRAAVTESDHRVAKVAAEARAARVRALGQLATARIGLAASSEEAILLRTRVLPGTERAVDVLRRGYETGRFAQIEVIAAERARLAAREQYLSALTEAHHNAQQIERLTGVPLEVRP
jgi:cobalt-zinc-cadmium efflux system outer membrane protein